MAVTPEDYCRALESYLCRKNEGHLIRIVGPAFEQVCGWASRGVPLSIAQRGIDRYFDRYYARGPRRRPIRIEFCEADVLDVFDEWRRAVGVPSVQLATEGVAADGGLDAADGEPSNRHGSLPAHLDRVVARLAALRGGGDRRLDQVLDTIVRELDTARSGAKRLRGDARDAFIARLAVLDRTLIDAAREQCDPATLQRLLAAADEELAPFRSRMAPDAYERARGACVERALRDLRRLPAVAFE
jgi:hypothetical protein